MKTEILRMEDIYCSSHDVQFLEDFRLSLFMGETLGVLINNVYKRSLVLDVLCGNKEIDAGRIYYHDQLVEPEEYAELSKRRVACIGGKSFLIQNMSIAENIFVIRSRFKKYFIRKHTLEKQARILLKTFHVEIAPSVLVKSLSIPERIKIELIKASATGARIIILNDLSRFLSAVDIAAVFETVHALKHDGIAFMLMDTYLDVLFQYTDRLAVVDSGRMIRAFEKQEYDEKAAESILFSSSGQDSPLFCDNGAVQAFALRNVSTEKLRNLTLSLKRGEMVSLLDMDDSTNAALLDILTGEATFSGSIFLSGTPYRPKNLRHALSLGVCVISENPTETMLFPHLSALENLYLSMSGRVHFFFSRRKYRKNLLRQYEEALTPQIVSCTNIRTLSSEDLQRLVYVKWLFYHPKLLIVVRPLSVTDPHLGNVTQELIGQFAKQGACVLILSSNPSEAYRLGNTVYPCKDGKIWPIAPAGESTTII